MTILISLVVVGAAAAQNDFFSGRGVPVAQTKVTKEQARKIALERIKGEIVDEEYEKENGKMVYGFEIKQANGEVMEVKIDEMTGKIIFVGKDDGDADEGADDDEDDSMSVNGENESKMNQAELMRQAKISKADAEKIALARVQGTINEGELEMENGKLIYSFDILNRKSGITEVQVDAKTGKIVSVKKESLAQEAAEKRLENNGKMKSDDDDDDKNHQANIKKYAKQAKITMAQAKEIALKRIPGGTILEEDLEMENGRLQYAFDVKDTSGKVFDVEIDAKTGEVLKAVEDSETEDDND